MKNLSRAAIAASLVVVSVAIVFAFQSYRHQRHIECMTRDAVFRRRIRDLNMEAQQQLKVGTKKESVAHFFEQHKMESVITKFASSRLAYGAIHTIGGCSPLGCGTDNAVIAVEVYLDKEDTVISAPRVGGGYIDCL